MDDRDFERDIERLRAADLEFVCRPFVDAQASMIGIDELSPAWADGVRVQGNRLNKFESRPRRYGHSLTEEIAQLQRYTFNKFNNSEGEKGMDKKIDWRKPLRSLRPAPGKAHEVATYKSGKQRVVWVDDRIYPVDEQGRAIAYVDYGPNGRGGHMRAFMGEQIVENVPEEKFFLGLSRSPNGEYWITDGGVPTTMGVLEPWSQWMEGAPHWIVDTRKSAEATMAAEHDPKDWTVVRVYSNGATESFGLMTESDARLRSADGSVIAVRIRTTPAPADTARYIHLWRTSASAPWLINKFGDGRQEFTTAEVGHRWGLPTKTCCIVKVRD